MLSLLSIQPTTAGQINSSCMWQPSQRVNLAQQHRATLCVSVCSTVAQHCGGSWKTSADVSVLSWTGWSHREYKSSTCQASCEKI